MLLHISGTNRSRLQTATILGTHAVCYADSQSYMLNFLHVVSYDN